MNEVGVIAFTSTESPVMFFYTTSTHLGNCLHISIASLWKPVKSASDLHICISMRTDIFTLCLLLEYIVLIILIRVMS